MEQVCPWQPPWTNTAERNASFALQRPQVVPASPHSAVQLLINDNMGSLRPSIEKAASLMVSALYEDSGDKNAVCVFV